MALDDYLPRIGNLIDAWYDTPNDAEVRREPNMVPVSQPRVEAIAPDTTAERVGGASGDMAMPSWVMPAALAAALAVVVILVVK